MIWVPKKTPFDAQKCGNLLGNDLASKENTLFEA
jgi:hypothetical protein